MGKLGKSTLTFENPVYIRSGAAVVGPMEGEGPLKEYFDEIKSDLLCGETTWEKTEAKFQGEAIHLATKKAGITPNLLDVVIGGDLLNQLIATNFMAKETKIPYLGLYNACATMAESLLIASTLISGGFAVNCAAIASSHNSTSERQYRFPTELGVQRPQTAQWTVTGAGAICLSSLGNGPRITKATIGRVIDFGIKNSNEMGSAMAPAAFDTLETHLKDTKQTENDYDLILTGDLASQGHRLFKELCKKKGMAAGQNFQDSGILIYDKKQDVHSGGSGAGCSATVWSSYLLRELSQGTYKKVLLIGTGALLSPISVQQGSTIPSIAHAVVVES